MIRIFIAAGFFGGSFFSLAIADDNPEFSVDLTPYQIDKHYGYRTFNDLTVGESVSVFGAELCVNDTGGLDLLSFARIEEQPGIKITRVDEFSVRISELPIPSVDAPSHEKNRIIRYLAFYPCSTVRLLYRYQRKLLYVRSINGKNSLSELFNINENE